MDLYRAIAESTRATLIAEIKTAIERSYDEPTLVDRLEEVMRN